MSAAPAAIDIRSTFGSVLVGTVLGALFYGITLFQTLIYFAKYPNDSVWIKGMVLGLWIVDTITFVLEMDGTWFYLVISYANPQNLALQVFSLRLETIFTYSVSFFVHLFLLQRIHILTGRNKWITWPLLFLSFGSWALGLTITGLLMQSPKFADDHRTDMSDTVAAHKVVTMFIDIVLAGLLCWLLHQGRSGIKRTDSLINRLMFLAFNRGVAVACVQIMYLVTYFGWPNALYWIIPHYISSKLYVNTTLATLNIREALQRGLDSDQAITMSKMRFNNLVNRGGANADQTGTSATAVSLPTFRMPARSYEDGNMTFASKSAVDSTLNITSNASYEAKHVSSRHYGEAV